MLNQYFYSFNYFFLLKMCFFFSRNVDLTENVICLFPNVCSRIKTSSPPVLRRSDGEDVLLKLPLGIKVRDLKWLSVWCRRFTVRSYFTYLLVKAIYVVVFSTLSESIEIRMKSNGTSCTFQ